MMADNAHTQTEALTRAEAKLRRGTELAAGYPGADLLRSECSALVARLEQLTEALEAIQELPSEHDLLNNAMARAMFTIARAAAGSSAAEPAKHEGRIRMILDGDDRGDWIGYCNGCDWQVGPRPVDASLGDEVRAHERQANIRAGSSAACSCGVAPEYIAWRTRGGWSLTHRRWPGSSHTLCAQPVTPGRMTSDSQRGGRAPCRWCGQKLADMRAAAKDTQP